MIDEFPEGNSDKPRERRNFLHVSRQQFVAADETKITSHKTPSAETCSENPVGNTCLGFRVISSSTG